MPLLWRYLQKWLIADFLDGINGILRIESAKSASSADKVFSLRPLSLYGKSGRCLVVEASDNF